MDTYAAVLTEVRSRNPLVLHVTNTVTSADCANMSICFGSSPVMSDDPQDAAELASVSDALVLNIGTVSDHQLQVMHAAADVASARHIPIILDPAGAGASSRRKSVASELISAYPVSVIKGNADEISALAGISSSARGVDAFGTPDRDALLRLADMSGAVVAASGAVDIVTDGSRIIEVANGVAEMSLVSGTGCMASSCIGAAASVAPAMDASVTALAVLGVAGERAAQSAQGPGSFKMAFFDAVSCMDDEALQASARIREVVW